jgi:TolA-binding protein
MLPSSPRRSQVTGAALAALVAFGSPGCVSWFQNQAATAQYANQVTVVSERARAMESALADSQRRVAQLEETVRIQGQNEATRLETFEQVNAEINRLRGDIEALRFALDEVKAYLDREAIAGERRMLHAELRIGALEDLLKVKPPAAPTDADLGVGGEAPSTTPAAPATPEAPASVSEKLKLAKEHLEAGRPAVARALLEVALQDHPGVPEAAEIRYRIGKAWFAEEQYGKAGKAYQAVLDHHAKTEWASWAMFGQGECFEKLGKKDTAKVFFESVVDKYPSSPAAKDAKAKLKK